MPFSLCKKNEISVILWRSCLHFTDLRAPTKISAKWQIIFTQTVPQIAVWKKETQLLILFKRHATSSFG